MILKLGIIGLGFVGSSVQHGFNKNVDVFVVDPKLNDNTIDNLIDFFPEIVFICVPTPEGKDGDVDVSIAEDVLFELNKEGYDGIVVIKSTIVPAHLERFVKTTNLNIVYNPEFLTEANAFNDFCNPPMQILGGNWNLCERVEWAYVHHSHVKIVPTFKTDIITASLLKYTINSWLATKVMFMNEISALFHASGTDTEWDEFTDMLKCDKRIGDSHMQVPGPDGHAGFGGHCFPKDTAGLLHYAREMGIDLSVLNQAVNTNNIIRDENEDEKNDISSEGGSESSSVL